MTYMSKEALDSLNQIVKLAENHPELYDIIDVYTLKQDAEKAQAFHGKTWASMGDAYLYIPWDRTKQDRDGRIVVYIPSHAGEPDEITARNSTNPMDSEGDVDVPYASNQCEAYRKFLADLDGKTLQVKFISRVEPCE